MYKVKRKGFSFLVLLFITCSLFFPSVVKADDGRLPNLDKKIIISLSQENLTAYNGDAVFIETRVTTGGPNTPTPLGTYQILGKNQDFIMRSPWPQSDWRWYPDSFVHYALLFQQDGFFIHDAPWRSNFGLGSNTVPGIPGGSFTGTHGCVNVPSGAEAELYNWASIGTPIIIQG
jgi:lipoprotein-anchoring transpeptidase ErfK/SrfK